MRKLEGKLLIETVHISLAVCGGSPSNLKIVSHAVDLLIRPHIPHHLPPQSTHFLRQQKLRQLAHLPRDGQLFVALRLFFSGEGENVFFCLAIVVGVVAVVGFYVSSMVVMATS